MKPFLALLFFVFALFFQTGFAQANGPAVSGVLIANGKSVEAATVSLLKAKDSSLVKIAVTDKDGAFLFEKAAEGNYLISIDAINFQKYYSSVFSINEQKQTFTLNDVHLKNKDAASTGVVVISKRPLIEQKIDKTVVNVDASPTNTGLTALEVLEKSPGVTVDNNDNISLKGKQGVVILIDGKPTYLSGQDLANLLKNMSANQIDQIELMSQPSAKYDASGNSGIINIKTKKTKSGWF